MLKSATFLLTLGTQLLKPRIERQTLVLTKFRHMSFVLAIYTAIPRYTLLDIQSSASLSAIL